MCNLILFTDKTQFELELKGVYAEMPNEARYPHSARALTAHQAPFQR